MNTVELTQYSLGNAFGILDQVVADLTQEQADWIPPGCANPIGASYWHAVSGADEVVYRWVLGQEPLHQREGWQSKALTVSAPEPEHGGDYLAWMQNERHAPCSAKTLARRITSLKVLFGWLHGIR
jgi:hypothetical protein